PWSILDRPDRADWSAVPRRIARVLRRAVQWAPEARWPDAASFRRALWRTRVWPYQIRTFWLTMGGLAAGAAAVLLWRPRDGSGRTAAELAIVPFEVDSGADRKLGWNLPRLAALNLQAFPRITLVDPRTSFHWWDARRASHAATADAPERALRSPAGARQDHRPPGVARGAGVRAERARSRHRLAGRAGSARPARATRQPDRLGAGVGAPARPRRLLPRLARSLPAWGAGAERVPRRRGSVRARRLAAGGAALPSRHCLGFELRARAVAAFERAALAPHACPGRCAAPPGASAPRSERARPAAHRGPARALERGPVRPVRHRARSLSRRRLRCVALRGRAPEPRRACGRPPRQRAGCVAASGSAGLLAQAGVRRPGVGCDPAGPARGGAGRHRSAASLARPEPWGGAPI